VDGALETDQGETRAYFVFLCTKNVIQESHEKKGFFLAPMFLSPFLSFALFFLLIQQAELTAEAARDSLSLLTGIMEGMRDNIMDVLDIKHLSVMRAEANKDLVVMMFQEIGANE
jgi:hypothetical protein